jgi:hypothetical protein
LEASRKPPATWAWAACAARADYADNLVLKNCSLRIPAKTGIDEALEKSTGFLLSPE